MNILIVAATEKEISIKPQGNSVSLLTTGVGMVAATYQLTKKIHTSRPDFVIHAGIAGAIDKKLNLTEVVEVVEDEFYAFGSEDRENFLTVFELSLVDKNKTPFVKGKLINPNSYTHLKKVRGTTVQTTHGNEKSIQQLHQRSHAQIESMEGAAIMYVCLSEQIPFIHLRAVSNYVEPRNFENWQINQAIENLNVEVEKIIHHICNSQ